MRTQRKNKQAAKSAGKHGQSCDWFVVLYLIGWESHASLRILILFLVPSRMRGVVLKVVEMMGESVLTFKIPIQLLWVLKIYQMRARKRAKERARGLLGSFTNPRGPRARALIARLLETRRATLLVSQRLLEPVRRPVKYWLLWLNAV